MGKATMIARRRWMTTKRNEGRTPHLHANLGRVKSLVAFQST